MSADLRRKQVASLGQQMRETKSQNEKNAAAKSLFHFG